MLQAPVDFDQDGKKELQIFFITTYILCIYRGDYGKDSGGECAVPMVHRFHSPSNGNSLFWYSFDVGPVHVLYYSVEHDFRQNSTQYEWIEKDLRSVNRSLTPWLIVGSHRQMYTSENKYTR